MSTADNTLIAHSGGCHCGAVRFVMDAPACIDVTLCNCSICSMGGYQHVIVPQAQFALLSGADALSDYRFNTGAARHLFCRRCGIKSYYVPRSHPDGISVNARCLDADPRRRVRFTVFDGQNWEANISALTD